MSDMNNTPDLLEVGKRSYADLITSGKKLNEFKHRAMYVLVNAYATTLYEARVEPRAKDAEAYLISFGLDTFGKTYEDASSVEKGAMLDAVLEKSFGVVGETDRNRRLTMVKTINTAIALAERIDDISQVTLANGKHLEVPYTVLHEEPAEGAKQSEINRYKALRDTTCVLDKYSGDDSMPALESALRPKVQRGTQAPKVATFAKPVTITFEARVDAVAFAFHGKRELAIAVLKRFDDFEGSDDLAKWARVD